MQPEKSTHITFKEAVESPIANLSTKEESIRPNRMLNNSQPIKNFTPNTISFKFEAEQTFTNKN